MENKKINVLLEMADDNDGYVSVSDAARFGIAPTFISYLVELGQLTRIAKGLYIKKGYEIDRYYLLHYIYKKMIFGYESSLYLHGLINEPSIPDIVLPLNYMTKGIEGTLSRHLGNKEFQTGQILLVTPKGNLVPGYDLERLFIETIKRADDLDKGTIVSRLTAIYSKGIYKEKLNEYAKAFHLEGEVNLAIKLIGLEKKENNRGIREFDHEGIMLATFQAKLFEASLTLCEESSPIFMRRFFNSELAEKLDTKSPHTLLLDEEDAVRQLNEEFGKSTYGKTKYGAEAMYYTGWFYRYIAYTRMIPSHIVYKLIKPKIIIDNYYVYHTQDEEWVFERVISNLGLSEVDFNLNERFKRAYRRYLSESKDKLG